MPRLSHLSLWSLLLVGLFAAGCAGGGETTPQEEADEPARATRSVRVETLVLEPASFEDVIELTGSVEAVRDARLSAQSAGTIVALVERGAYVRAGQTVAQLDPGLAQAGVQQARAGVSSAEAQLRLAEDNYRRQEPLFRDSVISAIEFENVRTQLNQAEAGVEQAKAALAQAQEQLNNTRVTAPFSGIVEERFAEEGEQVVPGAPVARVVSTDDVKVTVGVPERYAGDIQRGTPVQITLQAYGGQARTGTVSFAGSAINPQNRTFPVEIELDNSDGRLKPEMVAKVLVPRERLDGALVVPQASVLREENGNVLYVVVDDGAIPVASRRRVELGTAYNGRVVIRAGVSAGDEVVVLGQTSLTDGDAVEVVERYTAVGPGGRLLDEPTDTPVAP